MWGGCLCQSAIVAEGTVTNGAVSSVPPSPSPLGRASPSCGVGADELRGVVREACRPVEELAPAPGPRLRHVSPATCLSEPFRRCFRGLPALTWTRHCSSNGQPKMNESSVIDDSGYSLGAILPGFSKTHSRGLMGCFLQTLLHNIQDITNLQANTNGPRSTRTLFNNCLRIQTHFNSSLYHSQTNSNITPS